MRVIATINGTITAESMAFYALRYAKVQGGVLVLLHIKNEKDSLDEVHNSMDRIKTIALSYNVKVEHVILKGSMKRALKEYLKGSYTDIIFCSTRKKKTLFTNTFTQSLTKMNLGVDIAVVRIVDVNNIMDTQNLSLFIKDDRLSVKKFTFFSIFASAYMADAEIYSVSKMTRLQLSMVNIHSAREKLSEINYNLRHYIQLSKFMPFNLRIKHDFTYNGQKSILTHIAKSDSKLVIIGAKRLSVKSFFQSELPIEVLLRESSVNIIAYYPNEA